MATQRRPVDLLRDIVEWSSRIEVYIAGLDFDRFSSDLRTQDAVIRCLEVIGEASAQLLKLDPGFQNAHPELELREAYRARHRTAHGYGSISLESVWASATQAVPRMAAAARLLLDE